MTTTTTIADALRAALDAFGSLVDAQNGPPLIDQAAEWECAMHEANAAIDALRAAIEAAESAQPAAWVLTEELNARRMTSNAHLLFSDQDIFAWTPWTPVWTHPPEPARQPMTETEAWNCICSVGPSVFDLRLLAHLNQLVRAVEAFHRIGVKTVGPESQCQRKDPEPEIAFLRRVADARQQIIDGMIAERCAKQDAEMPRPLADWHEDNGAVVWWRFPVDEPAWIGTPLDDDWPDYHTHWTPHPKLPERER